MKKVLVWATAAFACFSARTAMATPSYVVLTAPAGASGGARVPSLLAEWRETGMVADAWLLDMTNSKQPGFASLAVLQFPDESFLEHWQQKSAPAIGDGVIATKVDTLARGETFPRDSTKAVFAVAQYDVNASPDKYKQYLKGYVTPEMEALRAQKVLTSYFLFAARDRNGAPWQSLFVMEYRDPLAFERRDAAMAEVREKLSSNGSWKDLSDSKQSIRKEVSLTQYAWQLLPPPALEDLPNYKVEYTVKSTIRVLGSFLKFAVANLEEGFLQYQPDAQFASNFSTSSEGAISGRYTGISTLAPMGDDAKIPDMMPFFNVYGYLPLELAVATGDSEKRGALWPGVIVVNKENPITHINMEQLDRVFGSERTGAWSVGDNPENNILFTAKYARGRDTNIRTWAN